MPPADAELSYIKTKERVGDDFIVLPFHDNIDKVEVEIVYDPQLKSDQQHPNFLSGDGLSAMRMQEDRLRQYTKLDMGGNK